MLCGTQLQLVVFAEMSKKMYLMHKRQFANYDINNCLLFFCFIKGMVGVLVIGPCIDTILVQFWYCLLWGQFGMAPLLCIGLVPI